MRKMTKRKDEVEVARSYAVDAVVETAGEEVRGFNGISTEHDLFEVNDITGRAMKTIDKLNSARSVKQLRKVLVSQIGMQEALKILPETK